VTRAITVAVHVHLAWWAAFFAALIVGNDMAEAFWLAVFAGTIAIPMMAVAAVAVPWWTER